MLDETYIHFTSVLAQACFGKTNAQILFETIHENIMFLIEEIHITGLLPTLPQAFAFPSKADVWNSKV